MVYQTSLHQPGVILVHCEEYHQFRLMLLVLASVHASIFHSDQPFFWLHTQPLHDVPVCFQALNFPTADLRWTLYRFEKVAFVWLLCIHQVIFYKCVPASLSQLLSIHHRLLDAARTHILCDYVLPSLLLICWEHIKPKGTSCLIIDGHALIQAIHAIGKPAGAKIFGDFAAIFGLSVMQSGFLFDRIDVLFDRYYSTTIAHERSHIWNIFSSIKTFFSTLKTFSFSRNIL